MAPGILAVIPMKPLAIAKSRLAPHLADPQRKALACYLLRRAVSAAAQCRAITEAWVVGGDAAAQSLARELGATWLDDGNRELNEALEMAFHKWFGRGGDAALFLPADLPLVTPSEVGSLVEMSGQLQNIVLALAARDGGTNAILMPRALAFTPVLGQNSFLRHLTEAASRGYPAVPYYSRALGLDVDTLEDLHQWRSLQPEAFVDGESWRTVPVGQDKLFRGHERGRYGR